MAPGPQPIQYQIQCYIQYNVRNVTKRFMVPSFLETLQEQNSTLFSTVWAMLQPPVGPLASDALQFPLAPGIDGATRHYWPQSNLIEGC